MEYVNAPKQCTKYYVGPLINFFPWGEKWDLNKGKNNEDIMEVTILTLTNLELYL